MPNPVRVFLSYAHQDVKLAESLEESLDRSGILVWRDRTSLPDRGPTFRDEINRAVDNSHRLLLLLTAHAARSEHVRAEWQYAKQNCKKVTVLLPAGKNFDVPSELELELDNYVDWKSLGQRAAIETLVRILKEPTTELGILSDVPKLPTHWVPREAEIKTLVRLIFPDSLGPIVITGRSTALQGMGGIGKTVIAAAFARECRTRWQFSDGVFWLSFGLAPDLVAMVARMLELRPEILIPFTLRNENIARALSTFLEGRRCLLILDDVWRQEHAQAFLEALSPQGRILITTRDGEIVTNLGAQEHRIDVFSEDQAMQLLADWSGQAPSTLPQDARDVARECENLPFALSICGAMALDGIIWSDIKIKLVETDIGFLTRQGNLRNYPYPSVLRCLQASTEVLQQQDSMALERYLELAAFSRAQRVPEEAIVTLWTSESCMDAAQARALLARLDRKALLRLERRGTIREVSFHDLQRDFLDAMAPNAPAVHSKVVTAYRRTCHGNWADGPDDGYFFKNFPSHLARADHHEELLSLLSTFRWIMKKLSICGWYALTTDYDLMPDNPECRMIAAAVRLSAHAIADHPDELAPQLIGRLSSHQYPLVQRLLEEGAREQPVHFLCPVSASLTAPGGSLIQSVAAHHGVVKLLAASADGNRLASASESEVKVWNVEDFSTCFELSLPVRALALSSDGGWVAVSTDLHQVFVYDIKTKEVTSSFRVGVQEIEVTSLPSIGLVAYCLAVAGFACAYLELPAWAALVIALVFGMAIRLSSVSALGVLLGFSVFSSFRTRDAQVFLVSVAVTAAVLFGKLITPEKFKVEKRERASDDFGVTCVALSGDGSRIVVGSSNSVRIWDVHLGTFSLFASVPSPVTALSRSDDSAILVAGASDGTLLIWDGERSVRSISAHPSPVTSIAVSDDRKQLLSLSQDRDLKIWDLNTDTESAHSEEDPTISSVAYIPKHSLAVYGTERGELRVFDPAQVNSGSATSHTGEVLSIATQGSLVLTASADHSIRIWDCQTGSLKSTLRGHAKEVCCLTILPDRSRAVSGSFDGTVKIWDLSANVELFSLGKHPGRISGIAQLPDSECIISADQSGLIQIWSSRNGEKLGGAMADGDCLTSIALCESSRTLFWGDSFGVVKVDLSPLSAGKGDLSSQLSSERVLSLDPGVTSYGQLFISPYRPLARISMSALPILADSNGELLVAAYTEVIWVVRLLPRLEPVALGPVGSPISAIALLDSPKSIISGHQDGTLTVWDLVLNCESIKLQGHTAAVTDIACLPGNRVISASSDGKLRMWELSVGEARTVAEFTADGAISACAVAEKGSIIVAAEESGRVHFLRTNER